MATSMAAAAMRKKLKETKSWPKSVVPPAAASCSCRRAEGRA